MKSTLKWPVYCFLKHSIIFFINRTDLENSHIYIRYSFQLIIKRPYLGHDSQTESYLTYSLVSHNTNKIILFCEIQGTNFIQTEIHSYTPDQGMQLTSRASEAEVCSPPRLSQSLPHLWNWISSFIPCTCRVCGHLILINGSHICLH